MKYKVPLSADGNIDYESINTDEQLVFEQSVMLRPLMQTFQIEETDLSYIVSWRHFSAAIIFYAVVVAVLSPLCFLGTANLFNKMNEGALFLLAFLWFIWFSYFGGLLNALFGKTRFVLDSSGLEATWMCLIIKQRKRIAINNLLCFKRADYPRNQGKRARKQGNWATRIRVMCDNNNHFDYVIPISIMSISAQKEFDDICIQLNAFAENIKSEGEP